MKTRTVTAILLAGGLAAAGAAYYWHFGRGSVEAPSNSKLPFERLTNTFFTPEPADALAPPEVRQVRMPPLPREAAVWGSTGQDDSGNVWIGVSANGGDDHSAHLVEYEPTMDLAVDRGGVLENLEGLGLLRPGEEQVKIHSKIVQGGDGHLYFASMNDTHEDGGPRPPPFGSHLWRVRLPERHWEHLFAAAEGLIAVAGGGDYIYALGYPDHRLAQFHIPTGRTRWVTVGSREGHISRNLIADARGHAFVPRLRPGAGPEAVTLVEFDTGLKELAATPLKYYMADAPVMAHGIVAFQHTPDRSVYFTTDIGRLYRISTDSASGPALVSDLGWFHPAGTAYTPCLFTYSGTQTLVGLGRHTRHDSDQNVWITFDLPLRLALTTRFVPPAPLKSVLLYGCQTRDRFGNFYAVGQYNDVHSRPLVLRIGPGKKPAAETTQ